MAIWIELGEPEENERAAIQTICRAFTDEWALLTSIPKVLTGKETDACLIGPRGMIVLELKYYSGDLTARLIGKWDGISGGDRDKNPIEQAGKCAQRLKSALLEHEPALAGQVYVNSCVVLTHPQCTLSFGDDRAPSRVGLLSDVQSLVAQQLRGSSKPIGFETLQAIFSALLTEIPPELCALWQRAEVGNGGTVSPTILKRQTKPFPIAATVLLLCACLIVVGAVAYFWQTPAWPHTFSVAPGVGNSSANVRSGGSSEYRVVRSLPRGAVVVGVGDVLDRNNARWIKLSDGSGFIKASVLQQADTASSRASFYMNSITPELIKSWGIQLLIVAGCVALLYWFKVRLSSIVFLAAATFALIHYGPEIRAWFNSLSTLAPNITSGAPAQIATPSDDDFDCNPSHHCRLNFDGDNESAPIAIVDRYGRGGDISFCPGVPVWVDEHPLVVLHGWYRGTDLGTVSVTRADAEAALAGERPRIQFDHVTLRRTNSSVESVDYWFTRSSRC